jgi:hypothetical protein
MGSKSETNKDLGVSDRDDIRDKSFDSYDAESSKDSFKDDFDDSLGNGSSID